MVCLLNDFQDINQILSNASCLSAYSESPFSEHGALEEVENEGGTETHTSEDGEWQHSKYIT